MFKFLSIPDTRSYIAGLLMLVALLTAELIAPKLHFVSYPKTLEQMIPVQFSDWTEVKSNLHQVGVTTNKNSEQDMIYDEVMMRNYRNSKGQQVMLTIAWGQKQRQEIKIHRPEVCYAAQGFNVEGLKFKAFQLNSMHGKIVSGNEMLAENNEFQEAVTYWIRIGDIYSENGWQSRLYIFVSGLMGNIPDGVLVRVSSIIGNDKSGAENFKLNQEFLYSLITSMPADERRILIN